MPIACGAHMYILHSFRLLLLLLLLPCVAGSAVAGTNDLYIMGFLPMTGHQFYGGGACLPAIEIALQLANDRADILPGYTVHYTYMDDQCDAGYATDAMYQMLYSSPVKHIISGPGCSTGAEATARTSHMWNLTHLSWGGASPLLSDRSKYPRFFRIVAPDTRFNAARLALLRHFNWTRVATISVALDYFFAVTDDFLKLIKGTDIHVISQEIFNGDPTERVQNLKARDARIILSGSYENHARQILCAAYHVGLYGPKIVWIFPGWYVDYWWRMHLESIPCTSEQMDTAAEGQIQTGFSFYNQDAHEKGDAGLSLHEFQGLYHSHAHYRPDVAVFEHVSGICFDSAWGSALALNCTEAVLKERGQNKTLAVFNYTDGDIGDVITSCTHNLTFMGLSGIVDLTQNDPVKAVEISQVYDLETSLVGMYERSVYQDGQMMWKFNWIGAGIKWRGNNVPRDATQVTQIEVTVPRVIYIVMSCLATLGILMSAYLLVFNIHHRENVSVKLSSPNINNILLLGCMFTYSTVFMYSYNTATLVLCKLRMFIFIIGFSMAFGALLSKTWRVYRIFANKKLLRLQIRDSQLVVIVGLLLTIVTFVMVLWEIVDPLAVHKRFLTRDVYLSGNDAEVHPYIRECVSPYEHYFTWTIYILEGMLLVFGAFLSYETRHVKIAALNDSRQIGLCLYNVVVLAGIGLVLSLVLDTQVALIYGITSGFVILGTTSTQLIIFIPKITAVYYPHRVEVETSGSRFTVGIPKSTGSAAFPASSTSNANVPSFGVIMSTTSSRA